MKTRKLLATILAATLAAGANDITPAYAQQPNDGPSPDYVRLLKAIADPSALSAREARSLPANGENRTWLSRLSSLEDTKDPAVQPSVKKLLDARKLLGTSDRDREIARADEAARMAAAGAPRTEVRSDFDIMGRQTTSSRTVEGVGFGDLLQNFGAHMIDAAQERGAEAQVTQARKDVLFDSTRLFPKVYPPSPEEKGLITPRIDREGIAFANTSGRTLRDLTIYVELVHFCSLPDPAIYRVVFAEELRAGAALYIFPDARRNYFSQASRQGRDDRPDTARSFGTDEDRWTLGYGGYIAARITAWDREGHQSGTVTSFADAARRGADYEARAIQRVLAHLPEYEQHDDANKKNSGGLLGAIVGGGQPIGARAYLANAARRVLSLAPDDAALTAQANAVLANPDALVREASGRLVQEIRARVTGRFYGEFQCNNDAPTEDDMRQATIWGYRLPKSSGSVSELWERVRRTNARGTSVLDIAYLPAPDNKLVASLYPPGRPELRRVFDGRVPEVEFGVGKTELACRPTLNMNGGGGQGAAPPDPLEAWRQRLAAESSSGKGTNSPSKGLQPSAGLGGGGTGRSAGLQPSKGLETSGGLGGSGGLSGGGLNRERRGGGAPAVSAQPYNPPPPAPVVPVPAPPPPPERSTGPDAVNFNLCANKLELDLTGDTIKAVGWSGPFKFPMTFSRKGPQFLPSALVAAAQERAVKSFPDLADPKSTLHKEFVRRYREYQESKKEFFDDPEWPSKLAEESQLAVPAR